MSDISGQTIRGYQLGERIGKGGFGAVYKAYQPLVEREVVIKVILPLFANDPYFIRSFEAEAHLIARLEHIHIVPLYDYWRDPDGAYLVMRWLRGGSLLDSIQKGSWDVDAAVKLMDQLAGALTIAHRNKIVHQDIKPANILLDEDGNSYLSDFGLAKDLSMGIDLASSSPENIHGSPAYISPEQISRQDITPQTDIYSLGIVLFELLTGHHPFPEKDIIKLLQHQMHTTLPSLRNYKKDLPSELDLIIWKATAKDPQARYISVLNMAEEFRQVVVQNRANQTILELPQSNNIPRNVEKPPTLIISLSSINLSDFQINPYKGLHAFQEADAADFFGRDQLVQSLIQRMKEDSPYQRFLAVIGPSGSGKSSAVKAGLLPAIRKGALPNSNKWYAVEMTPGSNPLKKLEDAILRVATRSEAALFKPLYESENGLVQTVNAVLPSHDSEFILVIDQFEEIFTLVADEDTRQHFINTLYQAVISPDSRLRIIITLRADFYDRPLLYTGFGNLIRSRSEVVLPLSFEELQDTITMPAERAGLTLEPGLAKLIIEDVGQQPGSLPLLQYALTELYERRSDKQLTIKAYRDMDGISGALARRADEIYTGLTAEKQLLAQQIFLRLVTLGDGTEDTRRRALQTELFTITTQKTLIQEIIDRFAKYRLLAFDRDPITRTPTIEVAHEALIRRWKQLQQWLNTNRDDLRTHRHLTNATIEWLRANRDASYLVTGNRLLQFENLEQTSAIALSSDEREYIRQSIQQRQRAVRRRQMAIAALIIFSVVTSFLALLAFDQSNKTDIARTAALAAESTAIYEAHISRSRELAASALTNISQNDLSLLLSMQALKSAVTFEARNSLLTTLLTQPHLNTFLHGPTNVIRTVAYSPDGKYIAAAGRDNTITLWDTTTLQPSLTPMTGHSNWLNVLDFSPDSQHLASGGEDGQIMIWDVNSGESQPVLNEGGAVWGLAYSPDGSLLASGGADRHISLWDTSTHERITAPLEGHQDTVYALAFSPDGKFLASGSADGSINLWDMNTTEINRSQQFEGHTNWVLSLVFDASGTKLASGSADNTIRLWDIEQGAAQILRAHTDWVRSIAFNDDGTTLASGGADGRILFWDVATGQLIDGILNIGQAPVWDIAYSADSQQLVTGGGTNEAAIWDLHDEPALGTLLETHNEQILSSAFSPDGDIIATTGGLDSDFYVHLWRQGEQAEILSGIHTASVTSLMFNPAHSQQLATASLDQRVVLWDLDASQPTATITLSDSAFSLSYSPGGNVIAVGDNDGLVTFWDVATGMEASPPIQAFTDRIISLSYSKDGRLLATASRDSVKLWDAQSHEPYGELISGHSDGILKLAFSPDAKLLATASRDTTIRLWDVTTGEQFGEPLAGHSNWVMDVEFSPDGQTLASASGDRSVILWDVQLGRMIDQPLTGNQDWVNTISFSPDGTHLVSGSRNGQVMLWQVGLEDWISRACHIANRDLSATEIRLYFQDSLPETTCSPAQSGLENMP